MHFLLSQWILDFVGEHACGEAGNHFLRFLDVSGMQHVIVDQHIVSEECHLRCRGDHDRAHCSLADRHYEPCALCLQRDHRLIVRVL
jgi:hypothetical protein